jgi:hypothetical protein
MERGVSIMVSPGYLTPEPPFHPTAGIEERLHIMLALEVKD